LHEALYPLVEGFRGFGELHGERLVVDLLGIGEGVETDAGFGVGGEGRVGDFEVVVEDFDDFSCVGSVVEVDGSGVLPC